MHSRYYDSKCVGKLSKINITDKEKYQELFLKLVQQIKNNQHILVPGEKDFDSYILVTEDNRMGAYFLHIVPKETYSLFKEMQTTAPHQFLGFSVLVGKHNGREVRVSCFGVQCTLLGKSLIKKPLRNSNKTL